MTSGKSLVLAGAGRMGGALLRGWVMAMPSDTQLIILEPDPSPDIAALVASTGVRLNPSATEITPANALVLAVKPQVFPDMAQSLQIWCGPDTLVLSLMAGIPQAIIAAHLKAGQVARCMPNTPGAFGRGITGLYAPTDLAPETQDLLRDLLSPLGAVVSVPDEDTLHAVTAVSGSGPAYVFHLAEAMTQAGIALGLAPDLATTLARHTIAGAGHMLSHAPDSAEALRKAVTSPGGTTAAALAVLMDDTTGLAPLMIKAMQAADARSRELGS